MIFCSVHVLYYGCISLLSFSEIQRKITSNHLLQLEMLRLSKNSYLDDFAHKVLIVLHTNFLIFDDSTHEFWRMIEQLQHSI